MSDYTSVYDNRIENRLQNAIDGSTAERVVAPKSRIEYQIQQLLEGGGTGRGKVPITILGNGEFNPLTGVPTIVGAQEDTFYLVPDGDGSNLYSEWIYHDGKWENFGYGGTPQVVQSDWNQNDSTAPDYIKNKPSTATGVGF